jgi:hypothetical protein
MGASWSPGLLQVTSKLFAAGAALAPVAGLGDVVVGEGDVAEELFYVAQGAGVRDGAKEELDGSTRCAHASTSARLPPDPFRDSAFTVAINANASSTVGSKSGPRRPIAYCSAAASRVPILDVPGHRSYEAPSCSYYACPSMTSRRSASHVAPMLRCAATFPQTSACSPVGPPPVPSSPGWISMP